MLNKPKWNIKNSTNLKRSKLESNNDSINISKILLQFSMAWVCCNFSIELPLDLVSK